MKTTQEFLLRIRISPLPEVVGADLRLELDLEIAGWNIKRQRIPMEFRAARNNYAVN